jgi:hypothetical protein
MRKLCKQKGKTLTAESEVVEYHPGKQEHFPASPSYGLLLVLYDSGMWQRPSTVL